MNYTVNSFVFELFWDFSISKVCAVGVELVLYGALLVLLCIAAYLLYHRNGGGSRRIFAVAASAMALLATLQLVLHIFAAGLALQRLRLAIQGDDMSLNEATKLYNDFYTAGDFFLVTNNVVTDGLFIYRCYVVWGRNLRVVATPILLLLASTVLGYITAYDVDSTFSTSHVDFRISFGLVMLTNVLLMSLTAGRIWWARRDAALVLNSAYVRKYDTVIAMILESGAIYCITLIINVIPASFSSINWEIPTAMLRGAMPQMMNIAPLLIIVRAELGRRNPVDEDPERQAGLRTPRAVQRSAGERAHAPSYVLDIRAAATGPVISLSELGKEV
ncbi:hypothetical protein C8R46DRAFT_1296510 [Mycena filopes]|nr:hypothetical protein C8R46DRAFT_1296510 [Mycena filopes]